MSRSSLSNLDRVTQRIMLEVAIGDTIVDLPYTADDGSQPLVVTTPGEYLSDVIERVELAGGAANIILAYTDRFHVFSIRGEGKAEHERPAELDEMNNDLSMGMFFMRGRRQGPGWFKLAGTNVESTAPAQFSYSSH